MAYTAGDTIRDNEYNLFAYGNTLGAVPSDFPANVQRLWGGNPNLLDRGYGQSGPLTGVFPGSTITATKWASMLSKINSMAAHQGTTITPITNPTVGNTITAYTDLQNNVDAVWDNRLNCAVVNPDYTGSAHTYVGDWANSVHIVQTLTFSSESNLYDFFNCGGMIDINPTHTGVYPPTAKNNSWTQLCDDLGHLYITSDTVLKDIGGYTDKPGSFMVASLRAPYGHADQIGVFQFTTSDEMLVQYYAAEPSYVNNHIAIYGKKNGNVVTVTTVFSDISTVGDPDVVGGVMQVDLGLWSPDTTYLSQSWGSVLVEFTAYTGTDVYNLFVAGSEDGTPNHSVPNVNTLWGVPLTVTKGYGQLVNLPTVSSGDVITDAMWDDLIDRIDIIASHQDTTLVPYSLPITDNLSDYVDLQTNMDLIWANRLNCYLVNPNYTGINHFYSGDWSNSVSIAQTVTFVTEDDLFEFFNAGGMLNFNPTHVGTFPANAKNISWTNLCDEFGHYYITSDVTSKNIGTRNNVPGSFMVNNLRSPSTLRTDLGIYQLGTSDTMLVQMFADETGYTDNHIAIYGKRNGNVVTITTVFTDASTDPTLVSGDMQQDLGLWSPDATYISWNWGSVLTAFTASGS